MSTLSRSSRLVKLGAISAIAALTLAGCAAAEDSADDAGSDDTSSESSDDTGSEAAADLVLPLGTALPVTGSLAFLGPPEIAGVDLAIADINAADKGIQVTVNHGDSGDLENRAFDSEIPRLLNDGVSAIIGAASSGVSLAFIDQVVGAETILFSPANTSPAFTTYEDDGLYFRTAPSDTFQGEVLGNLLAADGHQRVGMIVLNDAYGTGLAEISTATFEAAGGEVVAAPTFNPGDTNFTSQINEILAADPDAIVLITFDEAFTIVPELTAQFPGENLYFVDGNIANYESAFEPGTLEGAKGTGPAVSAEFFERLAEQWALTGDGTDLVDYQYGPESYDAVVLLALASLAAGSTDALDIAAKLQEVSGGSGDGEKCTTFSECADIINGGGVADYDGQTGAITFDELGERTDGRIAVSQYDENNFPVVIN